MLILLPLLLAFPCASAQEAMTAARAQQLLESGEPLAPQLAGMAEAELSKVGRIVAVAERLPSDWMAVLEVPEVGRVLARRMAHDGLPPGASYAALGRRLERSTDPAVCALVAAAALVSKPRSERLSLSEDDLRLAVDRILRQMLYGEDGDDSDLLFQRVRAHLGERELSGIVRGLREAEPVHRRRSLSLLMGAPYPLARPALLVLALDEELPVAERVRLADHLLLADGRPMLERFIEQMGPDFPDELLRRILIHWQGLIVTEDLPVIERLVDEGPALSRHFALQLWGRFERDPARRLAIFGLAVNEPSRFRAPALEALARVGHDEAIGLRLVAYLDGADREMRALAVAYLPAFVDPATLVERYRARLDAAASPRERAWWALALSNLPVPEARTATAEWLAGGGWGMETEARRAIAALEQHEEIDPYLPRLLSDERVPRSLRFRLAMARVSHSAVARDFLRRLVETESGVLLANVVEELARAGEPRDARLLWDLARDTEFDPTARAASVKGLAGRSEAASWLKELIEAPPAEYEVTAALLAEVVRQGPEQLRGAALAAAREGAGFAERDLRRGLRIAVWRAQASRPRPEEAEVLAAELIALLEGLPPAPASMEQGLDDPRELAGELPGVDACGRALAAAVAGGPAPSSLREWKPERVPLGPLLFAAALLGVEVPEVAAAWARFAAETAGVPASAWVRAVATWARATEQLAPPRRLAPLDALLARPWDLRAHPWDLEFGLAGAQVRTWVVPADRLGERRLLAAAAGVEGEQRSALLRALLNGYADPVALQDASELALEDGDGPLSVSLARRAVEWAATEPGPRLQFGRALELSGDPAAVEVYGEVSRMPLSSDAQKQAAQAGLDRLDR